MLSKLDQNQGRQMEGKALIIKNKLGKRQMIVHLGTKKFFLSFFFNYHERSSSKYEGFHSDNERKLRSCRGSIVTTIEQNEVHKKKKFTKGQKPYFKWSITGALEPLP